MQLDPRQLLERQQRAELHAVADAMVLRDEGRRRDGGALRRRARRQLGCPQRRAGRSPLHCWRSQPSASGARFCVCLCCRCRGEHSCCGDGVQFLSDIYASGGQQYFDAVALHVGSARHTALRRAANLLSWDAQPYGQPGSTINSIHWSAITETYGVLAAHNDSHKAIWINEFGWDTSDENFKVSMSTANAAPRLMM